MCSAEQRLRPNLTIVSTYANILLGLSPPAICPGFSTCGGAHTVNKYVNFAPLGQGMGQLFGVVEGTFSRLA